MKYDSENRKILSDFFHGSFEVRLGISNNLLKFPADFYMTRRMKSSVGAQGKLYNYEWTEAEETIANTMCLQKSLACP
jgi:hypothetical protein